MEGQSAELPVESVEPTVVELGLEPGLERIIFFSDAVFAIAMTLLVIDLRPPDVVGQLTDEPYLAALGDLVPKILAYLLSFAVIGLYWLAHWRRYHYIVRANERLAGLNLLLLGAIAFIPFPTALIGAQGHRPIVVVVYASTLALAGILGTITWLYASRAGLTRPGLSPEYVRLSAWRGLSVPIVTLASLPLLPFVGPFPVEMSWLLIFVVQAVISRRFRGVTPQTGSVNGPADAS